MITFQEVSFSYPNAAKPAVAGRSLRIPKGEFVLVAGKSGSGKSTFLRCLNGLVPHFSGGTLSGRIEVAGLDPVQASPKQMSRRGGFRLSRPGEPVRDGHRRGRHRLHAGERRDPPRTDRAAAGKRDRAASDRAAAQAQDPDPLRRRAPEGGDRISDRPEPAGAGAGRADLQLDPHAAERDPRADRAAEAEARPDRADLRTPPGARCCTTPTDWSISTRTTAERLPDRPSRSCR